MSLKNYKNKQDDDITILNENILENETVEKSIKIGRPKKETKNNKQVNLYFNEEELKLILSKSRNIPTSIFLKQIILNNL